MSPEPRAYEGYRKEAVKLDSDFSARLFGSALARLDEAPSRFFDSKEHSTPIEALLQNGAFQNLVRTVPEAKEWLKNLAAEGKVVLGAAGGAIAALTGEKDSGKPKPEASNAGE